MNTPKQSLPKRQRVWQKTNGRCAYCGKKLGTHWKSGVWSIDHFVPLSRHGARGIDNLMPACLPCNSEKSNMLIDEWKQQQTIAPKSAKRLAEFGCLTVTAGAFSFYFERMNIIPKGKLVAKKRKRQCVNK